MSDKAGVINGVDGGGEEGPSLNAKPQSVDIVDGWKRVAQINMKAIQQVCMWLVFCVIPIWLVRGSLLWVRRV